MNQETQVYLGICSLGIVTKGTNCVITLNHYPRFPTFCKSRRNESTPLLLQIRWVYLGRGFVGELIECALNLAHSLRTGCGLWL